MHGLVVEAVWDARTAGAGHDCRLALCLDGGRATVADDASRLHQVDAAKVTPAGIRNHLSDTYVTWAGGTGADDAFYVRVHRPVVCIEVDCRAPGPLRAAYGGTEGIPTQMHVHSVIRTPNGNDYRKELLRQHYLTSPHHR